MKTFAELGLRKQVLDSLNDLGFKEPTDIQEKTIPLALAGKDIIGGSATGSGKTLAFASPILENLKPNNFVQALILTPTRELAEQVSGAIENFSKNKELKVIPVYGGVSIGVQIRKLAVADVVVGTPGRILDHMQRKTLRLDHVKILVLDEVDRMFDMGFHRDVEKIINDCPEKRQTMLFSATVSSAIDHLSKKHTKNAVEISVESYVDHAKLKQIYYDVQNNMKFSLLVHLLNNEDANLIMVFCSTRRNVDFVASNLKKSKIDAMAIHGGLTQNKRSRIMSDFHGGGVHVLVCTDVAARGLDISGVSHVYNYDLPPSSDDYVHRIGRTARAGKEGIAISLLSSRDYENFSNILRNDSLKIDKKELPKFERVEVKATVGSYGGGSSGRYRERSRFSNQGRSSDRGRSGNRGRSDDRSRSDDRGRFGNRGRPPRSGGMNRGGGMNRRGQEGEDRGGQSRGSEHSRDGGQSRGPRRNNSQRDNFHRGSSSRGENSKRDYSRGSNSRGDGPRRNSPRGNSREGFRGNSRDSSRSGSDGFRGSRGGRRSSGTNQRRPLRGRRDSGVRR